MTTTAPDWLTKRDGSLKPGIRDYIAHVMIGAQPLYRLEVRPAGGTFACAVISAITGKRLDDAALHYADAPAALAGGLDQLQAKLGW